jgi:hypothetical protein
MIKSYHTILSNLLLITQLIAALTGLIFWKKVKDTFWKWFVVYLVLIFSLELFARFGLNQIGSLKKYYYSLLVIPIEFLAFYYFYYMNNTKSKVLYLFFGIIYLLTFIPSVFNLSNSDWIIKSLSYTVGNLFIAIAAIVELYNQIRSNKIIFFRQNMMFYINAGVIIFYIGTLPFFAFYGLIYQNITFWTFYYTLFLIFNHTMYLFFTASFIWGRPNTY